MKLIKIHVENFGKLSDFEYEFHDGINLIKEPNGFGKSTLAAFIKAMLYGFPARGGRSIASNERKKYLPWQGGAYGGYLQFSAEGIQYRVTRRFGKTAAGDSFQLEDETNRTPSRRFSERLGEELFQLDAASFARSTYMPQRVETENGATLSIRARLSNLVDNTDDFHDYEDARERLRAKRSAILNYRGDGGKLKMLQEEALRLEHELAEAEQKREPEKAVSEEIRELLSARKQKKDELEKLREEIRRTSEKKAKAALYRQLDSLKRECEIQRKELSRLDEAYPNGYPEPDEMNEQRENAYRMIQADRVLSALTPVQADLQCKTAGDALFGQPETIKSVLQDGREQCSQLYELERVLRAQNLSPEEQSRQRSLAAEFAGGVPTEEERKDWEKTIERMEQLKYQREACTLSSENQQKFLKLETFFAGKPLTEEELVQAERDQQLLIRLREEMQRDVMKPAEKAELEHLAHVFAGGVPQEDEIKEKQRMLRRIEILTERRDAAAGRRAEDHAVEDYTAADHTALPGNERSAQDYNHSRKQRSSRFEPLAPMMLGAAGALFLCLGVLFFWNTSSRIGLILAVLGGCGLIAALCLSVQGHLQKSEAKLVKQSGKQTAEQTGKHAGKQSVKQAVEQAGKQSVKQPVEQAGKQSVKQTAEQTSKQPAEYSAEEARMLSSLERELSAFLLHFYNSTQQPADQLLQLLMDRRRYMELCQREEERKQRVGERGRKLSVLETRIYGLFQRFYPGECYRSGFIKELYEAWKNEAALKKEEAAYAEQRTLYSRELEKLSNGLQEIWRKYQLEALSAQPRQAVQKLRDDVREWRIFENKADMLLARRKELRGEIEACCTSLDKLLSAYQVEVPSKEKDTAAQQGGLAQSYEARFETLQKRAAAYEAACGRINEVMLKRTEVRRERAEAQNVLTAFMKKYGRKDEADTEEIEKAERLRAELEQMTEDCYLHQEYLAAIQKSDQAYRNFLKDHPELLAPAETGSAEEDRGQTRIWQAGQIEQRGQTDQAGKISLFVPDLDALLAEEKSLQASLDADDRRLNEKRQERESLLRTLEKVPGLEEQLRSSRADYQEAEENRRILDSALDYLEQAKNSLENSYVGQVEQRFAHWSNELLGTMVGTAMLDRDLGIHVEERGDKREIDSFSTGTADMLMICMRLALVDALFKGEKPFLILDDPFVNLDDAHTERALALLQELAKTHQILYLVCNSGRAAA